MQIEITSGELQKSLAEELRRELLAAAQQVLQARGLTAEVNVTGNALEENSPARLSEAEVSAVLGRVGDLLEQNGQGYGVADDSGAQRPGLGEGTEIQVWLKVPGRPAPITEARIQALYAAHGFDVACDADVLNFPARLGANYLIHACEYARAKSKGDVGEYELIRLLEQFAEDQDQD